MKGFTLIEVIIYIALFSILIFGAFGTVFSILESASKIDETITIEEEGNFLLRKINWVLSSNDSLNPPTVSGSPCSQTLTVNKISFSLNPIILRINTILGINYIEMKEGPGSYIPLTSANARITCLSFIQIPISGNGPSGITANITMDGKTFTTTKYLRK